MVLDHVLVEAGVIVPVFEFGPRASAERKVRWRYEIVELRAVGSRLQRPVCQGHREIHEERFVLVPFHEIDDVVGKDVLAIFALHVFQEPAVFVDDRALVTGTFLLCVMSMPHAKLVESGILDSLACRPCFWHFVGRVVGMELPFPGNACPVASVGKQVAERHFVRGDETEPDVVAEVVLAGHQLDPGRCAQGLHMGAFEADSASGHAVEHWSCV